MGKASSTKKVARAARAGGRVSSGQPRGLLFPGVLVLIVALGVSLVVYARNDRSSQEKGAFPQLGDHIHTAIGFNVCGQFLNNLPEFAGKVGLHTHGDGLIHVEPASQLGTGSNATLGLFTREATASNPPVDLEISDKGFSYMGTKYGEGDSCKGVKDPQLRLAYWADPQTAGSKPVVTTGGFKDRLLTTDGAAVTLYLGDPDAEIPLPRTVGDLPAVGSASPADMSSTTTTAAPGDTGSTSTTAPSGETTTTAAN